MRKGFIWGVVCTLLGGLVGAYVFIITGSMPANADSPPSAAERWMAHTSLRATLRREAPRTPNPVALTDANLLAGVHVYAMDCAVCHGAADAKPSAIATGLYQHAPQLAKHGVTDDPQSFTFWKVTHGIRLTGMPSFGASLNDTQRWQVVMFLKHMNALPPAVEKAWRAVPSVSEMP